MSEGWASVPLGEIMTKSEAWIIPDPEQEYKEVTVRLWGKGVVLRRDVLGAELGTARRLQVRRQQFILSRIDARNGALGLVPADLDGALVSNDFPTFTLNPARVLPSFLEWMSKTRAFVDLCIAASEGTTNRVRLKEDRFLATLIPFPPLPEQRRIVARIEELAAKIEEARGLRRASAEELEALFEVAVGQTFNRINDTPVCRLSTLATKIGSGSTPSGGRASYPASGTPFVRSLNVRMREFQWEGIAYIDEQTHQAMKGTQVQPGDVLLNITGASIGRVACVPSDIGEANVNQHVAIIRPKDVLGSRYLMYWLSQPAIQDHINEEQKGATRQGFTKAQIEAFELPLPALTEQKNMVARLDELQKQVDALKRLHAQTERELEALLPSVLDRAFKGQL